MRQLKLLLMVAICFILVLTACSSNSEKKDAAVESGAKAQETSAASASQPAGSGINPPDTFPISDTPITMSAFAVQLPGVEDLKTNWFTQHLAEKLNIHFDWDISTDEGFKERKQLELSSGDYPEIFLAGDFTKVEQMEYGAQGVLLPLNDLIEQYAPNIKAAFDTIPYLKAAITVPDGNIYALPGVNQCFHCTRPAKMWINTQWLDELGLEMPQTTEDFYQVLKAFKEKDPNKNNKADEIALSGAASGWSRIDGFLMNAFIYNNMQDYFRVNNGKVEFVALQPEWRDGLAYMNKLYKEDLIDPAAFTQPKDGLARLGQAAGDSILGAATSLHVGEFINNESERWRQYRALEPLVGPSGVQLSTYDAGIGNSAFAITNKAKNPEAAIRLVDYLYTSEGTLFVTNGPEGELWRKAEPGEKDVRGNQAVWATKNSTHVTGNVQNFHWRGMGPFIATFEFSESRVAPEDMYSIDGYAKRLFVNTKELYEPHTPPLDAIYPKDVFISQADVEEISLMKPLITDYVESNMVQFVTGKKSLDHDWDAYVKGFDNLNLARYLEIHQNALNTMQ